MITPWLITLMVCLLAGLALLIAARVDRGQCPPRSHVRDPRFRSPMSNQRS